MRGLTFYVGQKSFSAIILIFGNVPRQSDLGVKVGHGSGLDALILFSSDT